MEVWVGERRNTKGNLYFGIKINIFSISKGKSGKASFSSVKTRYLFKIRRIKAPAYIPEL